MEIIPGVGVELAKIGETRSTVEARLDMVVEPRWSGRVLYKTSPNLTVHYGKDDKVELVEVWYGYGDEPQVTLDGVQLTWRFIHEVVADLAAKGYGSEPFDLGYKFEAGFLVGTNGARWAGDLDPDAVEGDEREVSEFVSVAPAEYFRDPTPEEMEAFLREAPWEKRS